MLTSKLNVKLGEIKQKTTIDKMSPIKNKTDRQITEKGLHKAKCDEIILVVNARWL